MAHAIAPSVSVEALVKRLVPDDRKYIDKSVAEKVIGTFVEKRKNTKDVGQAITYTLSERHINNKSREAYSAYARLLRKFEKEAA